MSVRKIISGGQTGVDRAALDAALQFGVPIGGWCPHGRHAEDGPIPEKYPLEETPDEAYAQRTAWNVRDSDGTLVIVEEKEPAGGTALAIEKAAHHGRPVLTIHTNDPANVAAIWAWTREHDVRVLNVAGPRASEANGIYDAARSILERFLREDQS